MEKLSGLLRVFSFLVVVEGLTASNCPGLGDFPRASPYDNFAKVQCGIVQFTLYRKSGKTISVSYANSKLVMDDILPDRTVFIVHGYQSSAEESWIQRMKNTLLQKEYACTVILVDWKRLANPGKLISNYKQAVANTRVVNAAIVKLGEQMVNKGVPYLWCIGFSLGAHTCGHGNRSDIWDRITGLDPAGPFFRDVPLEAGLRPTSAKFVDVIHTDGKSGIIKGILPFLLLGDLHPRGHVDFYPNGAKKQPGCALRRRKRGKKGWASCSHGRAHEYFQSSLENCLFRATMKCSNHNNIPKSCSTTGEVNEIGYQVNTNVTGMFYLTTTGTSPYCHVTRSVHDQEVMVPCHTAHTTTSVNDPERIGRRKTSHASSNKLHTFLLFLIISVCLMYF